MSTAHAQVVGTHAPRALLHTQVMVVDDSQLGVDNIINVDALPDAPSPRDPEIIDVDTFDGRVVIDVDALPNRPPAPVQGHRQIIDVDMLPDELLFGPLSAEGDAVDSEVKVGNMSNAPNCRTTSVEAATVSKNTNKAEPVVFRCSICWDMLLNPVVHVDAPQSHVARKPYDWSGLEFDSEEVEDDAEEYAFVEEEVFSEEEEVQD
ncbi:hypothetical protein B0H10DRAFT_2232867 [Mycena sp. CBHHK59/15]|nr:hypothetical protein B0H10DRAFT_2232867 [Mycena sp. CBHHK59/15]